ncbi:plasmid partition protein ParG [Arsenophonus apicola]
MKMKMKLGNHKSINIALDAVNNPSLPTKKLQINIPERLHKEFKIACLNHDKEMTEITIMLIEKWLKEI